jgi:hypothetical protein
LIGDFKLLLPPERDACIDEGADARLGLGCAERDGELCLLSKVRERSKNDLAKAQSALGFRLPDSTRTSTVNW